MQVATITMVGLALVLSLFTYLREPSLALSGLKGGGRLLLQIVPILLAAFAIAGLVQVLVPRDLISKWLGAESGWRGIMLGSVVGAITPGGPYVSFPIVAGIYKAGASVGTVVAFVTAWSLWAVARLPIEMALIGPKVTLIRLASTLIFPPIAGYIAQTLFGRFTA